MKKVTIPFLFFMTISTLIQAQWNNAGFNYTTDRVAIGATGWSGKRLLVTGNDADHIAFFENTNTANGYGMVISSNNDPLRVVSPSISNYLFIVQGNGNVGIGTNNPAKKLEVIGDISLPSSTGNKQIYTWNPLDANWRIGMSDTPGFSRSLATSHVQYLTYNNGIGHGFAVGVNGGQSSFEIAGSNHTAFFRGSVGIGTPSPASGFGLDVTGSSKMTNLALGLGITTTATRPLQVKDNQPDHMAFFENAHASGYGLVVNAVNDPLRVGTVGDVSGGNFFVIKSNGNVGVGVTDPDQKLTVKGIIHTQEVRVDMTGPLHGPDYVFEKNYDLLSLTELERYINQNKHLPEVPSAKEMEKDGLNLKEMNLILLKKVEELTLHLIEMKKENQVLTKRVNTLEVINK
jgi:hypothetical protein